MGIKERRDIEKTEMKRKIIKAAIEIIEQEGYEKLSIRKIAAKIEYSPTTIYLYYKDKAEIIVDMSNKLYSKVFDGVTALINVNPGLSAEEQFYNTMCTFIKELCSESEMVKAIMFSGTNVIFANESADCTPTNSGIDILDNLISNGIAQKVFRSDTRNTSWMIVSALLGFVMSSIANQLHLHDNFDQLVDDFVKILMEGVKE
ncbi:TetR/AcrR family transcriptional regulator [Konateibacter massiliensis]|uniref:TetR/AcrR family transcriptional regulator n=1 Tax=Konateibacter massiliensis TaxID=2002841 RepID=UPI000C150D1F|nr:TetR/AcrR family transcriptional regulator [Konateibacter massiliensis]